MRWEGFREVEITMPDLDIDLIQVLQAPVWMLEQLVFVCGFGLRLLES